MKKMILLFTFLSFVIAQQAQQSNETYDFPIKPNTQKWQSFKSVDEMYYSCQIPQNVLEKLSTKALLQTCLNYPATIVLLAHNSPQQGFLNWRQNFNGINEFIKRKDAFDELYKIYFAFDSKGYYALKTDEEKGRYTFMLMIIEGIIVQDEITNNLTLNQSKKLLKISLDKFRSMENDEVYGFASRASTGRIVSKISYTLGSKVLKGKINTADIREFIKNGTLTERQKLLDIISEAFKINTNE